METTSIKLAEITREWYLIDAKDKTLGRLSSSIAQLLRGKGKPYFTPHMDMGDFVVIINADKIKLTGKKSDNKFYFKHTGYPGGAKKSSIKSIRESNPEFILNFIEKSSDDLAAIKLESIPPDRASPTGTSLTKRFVIAPFRASSTFVIIASSFEFK